MAIHPGRRPTLTYELMESIAKNLKSGCFVDQAAAAAGISKSAFMDWRRKGETALEKEAAGAELTERERLYADFASTYDIARGEAVVHAHAAIRSAFTSDWHAAAWFLERCDPGNRYGRRVVRTGDLSELPVGADDRDAAIAEIEAFLQTAIPDEHETSNGNGHANGNGHKPVEP